MTTENDTPDETSTETTVQNADVEGDNPDGKPDPEAVAAEEAPKPAAKKRAARKAAATRKAKAVVDENLSADGRTESGTTQGGGDVHKYEFENGLGAKVFRRTAEDNYEVAPTRDGRIIRNLPDFGRVPSQGDVDHVNAVLTKVAALK